MPNNNVSFNKGRVTTEEDDLYFEVWGSGKPLLLIAGGGGEGK